MNAFPVLNPFRFDALAFAVVVRDVDVFQQVENDLDDIIQIALAIIWPAKVDLHGIWPANALALCLLFRSPAGFGFPQRISLGLVVSICAATPDSVDGRRMRQLEIEWRCSLLEFAFLHFPVDPIARQ